MFFLSKKKENEFENFLKAVLDLKGEFQGQELSLCDMISILVKNGESISETGAVPASDLENVFRDANFILNLYNVTYHPEGIKLGEKLYPLLFLRRAKRQIGTWLLYVRILGKLLIFSGILLLFAILLLCYELSFLPCEDAKSGEMLLLTNLPVFALLFGGILYSCEKEKELEYVLLLIEMRLRDGGR